MKKRILVSCLIAAATSACGAGLESESDVSKSDPLYAQMIAECGTDALVLRVEDLIDDEALCCVTHSGLIPKLHCMTKSGASVTDPNTIETMQVASKLAKTK